MNESIKKTRGVIASQPPIIPHPPLSRSVFSRRLQLRLSNGSIVLGEKSIKIENDWDLILDRTDPRVGSETITHILDNHHSSTPSTRYVCQFSVTFFFGRVEGGGGSLLEEYDSNDLKKPSTARARVCRSFGWAWIVVSIYIFIFDQKRSMKQCHTLK